MRMCGCIASAMVATPAARPRQTLLYLSEDPVDGRYQLLAGQWLRPHPGHAELAGEHAVGGQAQSGLARQSNDRSPRMHASYAAYQRLDLPLRAGDSQDDKVIARH